MIDSIDSLVIPFSLILLILVVYKMKRKWAQTKEQDMPIKAYFLSLIQHLKDTFIFSRLLTSILFSLIIISACASPTQIRQSTITADLLSPTIENTNTPTAQVTSTPIPTPTLIMESQYGLIESLAGERLVFNDGKNPGVFTITNQDLSDPIFIGGDIPGFKWIESVSPDGKWIVFYTNCDQTEVPCEENNIYVAKSDGSKVTQLDGTFRNYLNYNSEDWDETASTHLIYCKNTSTKDNSSYGICAIKINGDKFDWLTITTENTYSLTTSLDQKNAIFIENLVDKDCISRLLYETLQPTRLFCEPNDGENNIGDLVWLPDNLAFITVQYQYMLRNETQIGKLLQFSLETEKPQELTDFLGGGEVRFAVSSNNIAMNQSTKIGNTTQIAICTKIYNSKLPVFYLYDVEKKVLESITDTAIIKAYQPEYGFYCGNGQFSWDDNNIIHLWTSEGSYILDFKNGTVQVQDEY